MTHAELELVLAAARRVISRVEPQLRPTEHAVLCVAIAVISELLTNSTLRKELT